MPPTGKNPSGAHARKCYLSYHALASVIFLIMPSQVLSFLSCPRKCYLSYHDLASVIFLIMPSQVLSFLSCPRKCHLSYHALASVIFLIMPSQVLSLFVALVFHLYTSKLLLATYRTEDAQLTRNRFPSKTLREHNELLFPFGVLSQFAYSSKRHKGQHCI